MLESGPVPGMSFSSTSFPSELSYLVRPELSGHKVPYFAMYDAYFLPKFLSET